MYCIAAPCWGMAGVGGCLVGGWLSDLLGRRAVLALSALPLLLSFLLLRLQPSLAVVLASRGLAGLGDGMMYPNTWVYLSEAASKEMRGTLGNLGANVSSCVGLLLTYSLALVLDWRQLALALTAPPALLLLGLCCIPESPYWLAGQGRLAEALRSLAWLRAGHHTEVEVAELTEKAGEVGREVGPLSTRLRARLKVLASSRFWRPFMLALPLSLLYSCSGLSLLTFYLVTVFQQAGSSLPPLHCSLAVSGWRLAVSLLSSLALLRLRRRPLFLVTTAVLGFAMASLGVFSYLPSRPSPAPALATLGWLPLALVLLIFAGGQLGFAPIIKVNL